MRALKGLLAAALAAASCSKARPLQGDLGQPVSWQEEIAPLLATNCGSCHSGAKASAGYRTASYLETLGPTASPVAVAGDPNSKLVTTLDPARADAVHAPVSATYDTVRTWVVDGRLSYFRSGVHESGILNPRDEEFHSSLVRAAGWNFAICQKCHGQDLYGGKAGVSCNDCHSLQAGSDGASTCSTCHSSPQSPPPWRGVSGTTSPSAPGVGAHQAHVFGKTVISAPIACSVCHQVPAEIDSPGHLDHLRPATLTFSGLALADGATPAWNGASCSTSYCHGGGAKLASDTAARQRTPVWTGGTSQAFCGSCHGLPPTSAAHAGISYPDCARCHPATVTPSGGIIVSGPPGARTSNHLNGVVDVTP